jgi:hypothetical protein
MYCSINSNPCQFHSVDLNQTRSENSCSGHSINVGESPRCESHSGDCQAVAEKSTLSTLIEGEVGSERCCLAVFADSDFSEGLGDRGVLLVDVDESETGVVGLPGWVNAP